MSGAQRRSVILGTGSELPAKVITNRDLEKMVETSDEWITVRTGIKERRVLEEGKGNADMAFLAAGAPSTDAGVEANDLDAIIMGTVSRTIYSRARHACWKICSARATRFPSMSSAACSGFINALSVADSFIRIGQNATRLWSSVPTRSAAWLNWQDRTTCILFGDGAGAVVLGASENGAGILSTKLRTDGSYVKTLYVPAGGSLKPATPATVQQQRAHHHDERQRGVQDRRALDGRDQPPGAGRGRRRHRASFAGDPASGQSSDHRRAGRAARRADGKSHGQCR